MGDMGARAQSRLTGHEGVSAGDGARVSSRRADDDDEWVLAYSRNHGRAGPG